MTAVADQFEYVVGIDTHARTHTYCLIHAPTGSHIDTAMFPTSTSGNNRAVGWITRRSKGATILAAVEGTSSYGASITDCSPRAESRSPRFVLVLGDHMLQQGNRIRLMPRLLPASPSVKT